jgi:hypothetical protein
LLSGRLTGESVELSGWGEALFDPLLFLAFPQHMPERDPGEGILRGVKEREPEYGTRRPLHTTMVLLDNIGEGDHT